MTLVLGVDGGQSGIRMRHSSTSTVVEVDGVSRLEGDTVWAVADAIRRGVDRGGWTRTDRVVLGLTTAPVLPEESDRLSELTAAATGANEVWLADDTVTTHAGALSGGWGVSLSVGTGVACLAVDEKGTAHTVDGHGYLLGDDGGAFWIGRRGLRAVLHAAEDRAQPTALTALAQERFGDLDVMHVTIHDGDRPANTIAQFARDVLRATTQGDVVAREIVADAANRLFTTARTAVRHAGTAHKDPVPLALGGRLLEPGAPLRLRLDDLLMREGIAAVRDPDADALTGALDIGASGPGRYLDLIHLWKEGSHA